MDLCAKGKRRSAAKDTTDPQDGLMSMMKDLYEDGSLAEESTHRSPPQMGFTFGFSLKPPKPDPAKKTPFRSQGSQFLAMCLTCETRKKHREIRQGFVSSPPTFRNANMNTMQRCFLPCEVQRCSFFVVFSGEGVETRGLLQVIEFCRSARPCQEMTT